MKAHPPKHSSMTSGGVWVRFRVRFQAVKGPILGGFLLKNPTNKAIAPKLSKRNLFSEECQKPQPPLLLTLTLQPLLFFFATKKARETPKKNKSFFSLRGTPKILGKERKKAPQRQGKSEMEKSKEIEKGKKKQGLEGQGQEVSQ